MSTPDSTWTIQEISNKTGLTPHTLRYYERIGLLRDIERDKSGNRLYSQPDLNWISFLLRLRETGMSIQQMLRYSDLRSQGDLTLKERRYMLEEHQLLVQERIASLQENTAALNKKIELYKEMEARLSPAATILLTSSAL